MCHCPAHKDCTPSLSVRVGSQSLLFKCFAGCSTVEVLRALRRCRLRIPSEPSADRLFDTRGPDALMVARAKALWQEAVLLSGSPGEHYLHARGIHACPPALRFHARTPIGRGRAVRFRPAIIAAVHERSDLVAVQRLFLSSAASALATDLPRARLTLGRPLGGAVMLERAGPTLGLAEGVETALSAATLLRIPVWATLGNERLARVALPPVVRRLVLLADADAAGRLAVERARKQYAGAGLWIETLWPWQGLNDWNDVLRTKGEKEEAGCGWRPEGQDAPHLECNP